MAKKQRKRCSASLLIQFSSVTQLCPTLQPHESQHAGPPCPSPTPGACLNSCPLTWWCHPTYLILCCPLLPPSVFPSIRVLSNESVLHIRWPKYWSFSFMLVPWNPLLWECLHHRHQQMLQIWELFHPPLGFWLISTLCPCSFSLYDRMVE